jgi:hypothetical protein
MYAKSRTRKTTMRMTYSIGPPGSVLGLRFLLSIVGFW